MLNRRTPRCRYFLLGMIFWAFTSAVVWAASIADLNRDGRVDSLDLGILMSRWASSDPDADLDANGIVGRGDLAILLNELGPAGPPSPLLNSGPTPTTDNPYAVSGIAVANTQVYLYVNGAKQRTIVSDAAGSFATVIYLFDGPNTLHATAYDGTEESYPSNSIVVQYNNTIPRQQAGNITQDAVWTPGIVNDPYIITGTLTVDPGVSLILQPGTVLKFASSGGPTPDGNLTIQGSLIVNGTAAEPVLFTSNESSPVRGDWVGIVVENTSTNTVIDYAVVEYATRGVDVDGAAVTISNSTFRNFSNNNGGAAIYMQNRAGGLITNNVIDNLTLNNNSRENGIYLDNSSPTISGNTIRNTSDGVRVEYQSNPIINGWNIITNNKAGIVIEGDYTDIGNNPNPTINNNNIYNNTYAGNTDNLVAFGFVSPETVVIDAANNWWGSTDTSAISIGIYDRKNWFDDSPIVNVLPFLDGVNGVPVVGNFVGGLVDKDTTFVAGTPYQAVGSLVGASGVALTVDAGTEIRFAKESLLEVWGTLAVNGQAGNEVRLTSTAAVPQPGDWRAIVLRAPGNTIDYAIIEYLWGVELYDGANMISNSILRESSSAMIALQVANASATISGNTLSNSGRTDRGVAVYDGSSITVTGNTIQGFAGGVYLGGGSTAISGNTIQNNRYGVEIRAAVSPTINGNNVITGNDYGIYVRGDNSGSEPAPVVNNNRVFANTLYNYSAGNFNNGAGTVLDATNNWWGTEEPADIANGIYDFTESTSSPTVDFIPYQDASGNLVSPTILSGTLAQDLTITPQDSYFVTGTVTVPVGVTLTIQAGTQLKFPNNAALIVDGNLQINGAQGNPVILTSAGATPAAGDWQGVIINSRDVLVDYVAVRYATRGIEVYGLNATISNSVISDFSLAGIYMRGNIVTLDGSITGSTITGSNQKGNGIDLGNASPDISNNTIKDTNSGIYISGTCTSTISGNTITNNNRGLYMFAYSFDNPSPVVNNNSIDANLQYDLYASVFVNNAGVAIDATNNWWGTVDAPTIMVQVYDYSDAPTSSPVVNFMPYLDGPNGSPYVSTVTYLSGMITGDFTLTPQSSYILLGGLVIKEDVTLTIDAGVTLQIPDNAGITVDGKLWVRGQAGNPVTFTSSKTSPGQGDWQGIIINDSTLTSRIDYAIIEYASTGIHIEDASPPITGSIIRNNGTGIKIEGKSKPLINNGNEISSNNYGIRVLGSGVSQYDMPDPRFNGNNIFNNTYMNYDASTNLQDSIILDASNNWWGTTDPATIAAKIKDDRRDPGSQGAVYFTGYRVNYAPYLDADGGNPVSGNYIIDQLEASASLVSGQIYRLLWPIEIPAAETVTIPAGVTLNFYGGFSYGALLRVSGTLITQGTADDPVIFTSGYASPASFDWAGIEVNPGASATLDGVVVSYAAKGVLCYGDANAPASVVVRNSAIHDNGYDGISVSNGCSATIQGNTLVNNESGINVGPNATPLINGGNIITANTKGVYVYGAQSVSKNPAPVVNGNSIFDNTRSGSSPNYDYYAAQFGDAANVTLDATNNWWGSGDAAVIAATIYDAQDNPADSPTVNFTPYKGSDGVPLTITLSAPVVGLVTNQASQLFQGYLSKPAALTINGGAAAVAPDNRFSYGPVTLVEGANVFTLVATDGSGNAAQQTITVTLDSLAPPGANLGLITLGTLSGGSITLTGAPGSVEAGSTVNIINTRSGNVVSVTANGDGSFTAIIGAQSGDSLSIVVTDVAGNTSDWGALDVGGSAPAPAVTITSPADNTNIAGDVVNISGTLQGPANTGVNVNGNVALLRGGSFYVNNLSLQPGTNTLTAVATAPDGATATSAITVTSTATSQVVITVDPDQGIAPLDVTFTLIDNYPTGILQLNFDFDGDGSNDLTKTTDLGSTTYTYDTPGLYTPRVLAVEAFVAGVPVGTTYTFNILVDPVFMLDAMLRRIYYAMLDRIKAQDIAGALSYMTDGLQAKFVGPLTANPTEFANVVDQLGNIEGGGIFGDVAYYVIVRQEQGQRYGFHVYLSRGQDGVWRVDEM